MALDIKKLDASLTKSDKYFLDANIWLMAIVRSPFPDITKIRKKKQRELWEEKIKYTTFFDNLIKRATHNPNDVKIVFPLILMSEIINTYLTKKRFQKFIDDTKSIYDSYIKDCKYEGLEIHEARKLYFKVHYRPSPTYKRDFDNVKDDILDYTDFCQIVSDDFGSSHTPTKFLHYEIESRDFNDNIYCELSKQLNCVIVTHDADFHVDGSKVVTLNKKLLAKVGL